MDGPYREAHPETTGPEGLSGAHRSRWSGASAPPAGASGSGAVGKSPATAAPLPQRSAASAPAATSPRAAAPRRGWSASAAGHRSFLAHPPRSSARVGHGRPSSGGGGGRRSKAAYTAAVER